MLKFRLEGLMQHCCLVIFISYAGSSTANDASYVDRFSSVGLRENKTFGITYLGSVSFNNPNVYKYWYGESGNDTTAVRITVISKSGASIQYPVLFVIRKQDSVLSWQVPILLDYTFDYYSVSRTLCPGVAASPSQVQPIYVDVTSMSRNRSSYSLVAEIVTDFEVKMDETKNITTSPSEPVFYKFNFPKSVDSVIIRLVSDSNFCTVISIQNTRCPVFDLDRDVAFKGQHQSMTQQATFTISRNSFENGLFIVIVVKANNKECLLLDTIHDRIKNISITVSRSLSRTEYVKATLVATAVYLGIYVLAFIFALSYQMRYRNWGVHPQSVVVNDGTDQSDSESSVKFAASSSTPPYGSISKDEGAASNPLERVDAPDRSADNNDVDFLEDARTEKSVIRTKSVLRVADLSLKTRKQLKKRYTDYQWNLLTLAIFYGLPVVQLVVTYQKILHTTGNEDTCFYNFACAQPLFVFSAFNSVFSNIGYVMLGILFLILVRRRDVLHRKAEQTNANLEKLYGIPEHYGVFYALGWALMMEGLMSASYHICPNYSNFQFDTSFMYLMACLLMLKLYQNRHPDITPRAHVSYLMMALFIFIAVIGVIYGTLSFWIVFVIFHIVVVSFFSLKLYYMGEFKLDFGLFRRIKNSAQVVRVDFKPTYRKRFALLLLLNVVNWAMALYGAIVQPSNFASFLLTILITNLMLYAAFYVIMKLICGEWIRPLPLFYIITSVALWAVSLYFFFLHVNSWQDTPAVSREKNRGCVLLNFYDYHDVWHFLSSMSLFTSFMVLMTLDDDLWFVPRDRIPVF